MNKYTDQEFTYRQVPVSYDGIAKLDIKGNTVAWNQLVQNGNFVDTSNWSRTRVSTSASSNVLTVTVTEASTGKGQRVFQNLGFNDTHKRLYRVEMKGTSGKTLCFGNHTSDAATYTAISSVTADGSWQTLSGFSNENKPFLLIGMNGNTSVGDSYQIRNVVCFDLTQMFGTGNEPTTVEEFTSLYPLSYYSYNQGTLLNFNGTGIKTTGKNLYHQDRTNTVYGVALTYAVSELTINGTATGSGPEASGTSFSLPSGTYRISAKVLSGSFSPSTNTDNIIRVVRGSDTIANFFLNTLTPQPFTVSGGDVLSVIFRMQSGTVFDNLKLGIQIESGSVTEYEPYKETITDLPISTYFPNGLKSAGDVYDELTPSKAVTRIGTVDLGTLTWADTSSMTAPLEKTFTQTEAFPNAKKPSANTEKPNFTCKFDVLTANQVWAGTYGDGITMNASSGRIQIRNSAFLNKTGAEIQTMLSGVYLNYELATPTEQDINADLFYKFYGDGTEEILPTNGSTPTTSAFFGDITYYNTFEGEVPYRKFWMINSKGERWNLTEREVRSFLNNPQGFGFAKTISTTRYGNAQVLTDITDNFPSPSGEVIFYDSHNSTRYEQYNEFVKFLSYEPVTLYYKLPFSFYSQIPNVYTLECVAGTLTKTESKNDNLMTCPITFNALSYYKGDEVNITGTGTSYTIANDGDFPVGFEITLQGSLTNPYVTLEQDGDLYGEAKFDDSTAFSSVYVNSNDGEQNVVLEQGGSILPNPLSYQDLSISNGSIYVTFVKLARGESTLTIGMDSGSLTNCEIKFKPIYRSV